MAENLDLNKLKEIFEGIRDERIKHANTATRIGNAFLSLLEYAANDNGTYLSREHDDTAAGIITFLKGLVAEGTAQLKAGAQFGGFSSGILGGSGAQVDDKGNAEFESITSRSSIIAKELIVNRQTAMESNFVFTESGLIESVIEVPPKSEGSNTTYLLKLQKRWKGDFTAFKENDVILASVNDLATGGKYYDMWMRALSVNTVANTIEVVCYPDSEVPGQTILLASWLG